MHDTNRGGLNVIRTMLEEAYESRSRLSSRLRLRKPLTFRAT